jgi:HAD superfamily hydrolase (TIGR01509 family)
VTSEVPGAHRGALTPGSGRGAPIRLPGRFRAAVFDMDGLLVDSEPLWALAETDLLARHGDRFTPADAEATHGRSIDETIDAYARRLGGADRAALRAELLALIRAHYSGGAPVRPGARELVRWLEGRMRLAVASNTDGDLVRLALEGAGLLDAFAAVVSGADVGRSKPHPDVYLAACRALGVEPRDAVAFEDSPAGVQAAKAAGMTCVGVPERDGVDLAAAGADVVVGSLAELVGVGFS